MRWHIANWIGLVLMLCALAVGMGGALFIASQPHNALDQVSDELGLEPEAAKDYRTVVRSLKERESVVEQAASRIAAAEAKAARAEEEVRSTRVRVSELANRLSDATNAARPASISPVDRPLPATPLLPPGQTNLPNTAQASSAVAVGAAGSAAVCGGGEAPLRCTLRFEPGSSGLDSTDRRQIGFLVQGIRAAGWRGGTVGVIGTADKPGPSFGLRDIACDTANLDRDALIACDRARSVMGELRLALQGIGAFEFAPARAQVATTPGPSPSYRRADIIVRPTR